MTTDSITSVNPNIKQQWQFTGKFAIKTAKDKNAAKIHWSQVNDRYDINIYTIFGISVMSIIGDDNKVTIDQRGDIYSGQDVQQLIYRLTRWHIPVEQLQHWVTGDVTNAHDVTYNDQGLFHQGNIIGRDNKVWQLTLSGYRDIDGQTRPYRLLFKSDDAYLKLAINKWEIQK